MNPGNHSDNDWNRRHSPSAITSSGVPAALVERYLAIKREGRL